MTGQKFSPLVSKGLKGASCLFRCNSVGRPRRKSFDGKMDFWPPTSSNDKAESRHNAYPGISGEQGHADQSGAYIPGPKRRNTVNRLKKKVHEMLQTRSSAPDMSNDLLPGRPVRHKRNDSVDSYTLFVADDVVDDYYLTHLPTPHSTRSVHNPDFPRRSADIDSYPHARLIGNTDFLFIMNNPLTSDDQMRPRPAVVSRRERRYARDIEQLRCAKEQTLWCAGHTVPMGENMRHGLRRLSRDSGVEIERRLMS